MLYAFVQKQKSQKSSSQLTITYIVGGRCLLDGDTVQRYVITQDKDLEETKKTFSPVTSLHIYSVQKCRLKLMAQPFLGVRRKYQTFSCPWVLFLLNYLLFRSPVTNHVKGSRVPAAHPHTEIPKVNRLHPGSPSARRKKSKHKKQNKFTKRMHNYQNTTNPKKKTKNPQAAQTKSDSNKTGSVKSFFGQSSTVKKTSEKAAPTGKSNASEAPKKNKTDSEKQSLNDQS
ncbi:unnamed protein product, partial [Porites evermanni]